MKARRDFMVCISLAVMGVAGGCSNDANGEHPLVCEPGLEVCGQSCCAHTCCDGVCIDILSDTGHCGGCGLSCESGEVCLEGSCAEVTDGCPTGKEQCHGECVDLQSDVRYCGDCSVSCAEYEVCRAGKCEMDCGTKTSCDGQCVDLTSDAAHCGGCGQVCANNMYCSGSRCVCGASGYDCDGDASNGCESSEPCVGETVTKSCEEFGMVACDGLCIDIESNPQHCGGCGKACVEGEICHKDECIGSSDPRFCVVQGLEACDGVCVDLQKDVQRCGACDHACESHQTCYEGQCMNPEEVPGSGENTGCFGTDVMCYGVCTDIRNDNANCGDCLHACGEKEQCQAGVCVRVCEPEEQLCQDRCIKVLTDAAHCGDCETSCLPGEACSEGKCACAEGRYDCDGNAENGCESESECSCTPGETRDCWRGEPENRKQGICQDGTQVCDDSGRFWRPCEGGVYPSALTCDIMGTLNGLDNDCDGVVDTVCRSECDLKRSDMSYIGCEYWSVYLYNLIDGNHTLVFSNPSTVDTATVYIFDKTGYESSPKKPKHTVTIAPQEVKNVQINAGWTNMCRSKGNAAVGTSLLDNAYYIRASHPITAYQFNPFGRASAHSNDASLLLPANVLGKKYLGMTWESESGTDHTSYLTVLATEPDTTVKIKTTAPTVAGDAIAAMNVGETREFKMDKFQVLTLGAPAKKVDQTGTSIEADKNIVVFGGSRSSYVPAGAGCCRDHLEEQLFPLQAWGKSYFAVMAYSEDTAANNYKQGQAGNFYIIQAQLDNTQVTLPASLGGVKTLNAGQSTLFETRESFKVTADKPISVGQFLPSMNHNKLSIGDPSFMLVVPYEQYRSDYAFMVPDSYDNNFITMIAPKGAAIQLDGKAVDTSKFTAIPDSDFAYGYAPIAVGVHRMEADKPFGLYSYGYHNMSSYGYPIGLDLKVINTN